MIADTRTKQGFDTPILFVVFNRPDTTRLVFEAIRKLAPRKLYISADGPREDVPADKESCRQVLEIVKNIDWECDCRTLFRENNFGCGLGPSMAFDWFFDNEEEGIILEDDCLPDQSFFPYCRDLLEKYRHDTRIMHISGSNFQYGWQHDKDVSYYFSRNPHEWGWASWRRAWKSFDFRTKNYPDVIGKKYLRGYYSSWVEELYRLNKINQTYNNPNAPHWWDYQWAFAININSGLAITPNVNLIKNIGFGENATHTISVNDKRAKNELREMQFPLRHPQFIMNDTISDRKYFNSLIFQILLRKTYSLLMIEGYERNG
ncbi:MAG: nucleotide-diphospho-sugar transferase [Bacteroidetes bacterium]|nr:nucleotide-diphospho-sugar transferase [Bacteroidota bacterium]